MGTIDTFRDLIGNVADDAKTAFDELLDRRPEWDDDWDWDDCDWDWDDDRPPYRRRGPGRGRPRGRRPGGPRRRRVTEAGGAHPALAEPQNRDDRVAEQLAQLSEAVSALRDSVQRSGPQPQQENRI